MACTYHVTAHFAVRATRPATQTTTDGSHTKRPGYKSGLHVRATRTTRDGSHKKRPGYKSGLQVPDTRGGGGGGGGRDSSVVRAPDS